MVSHKKRYGGFRRVGLNYFHHHNHSDFKNESIFVKL